VVVSGEAMPDALASARHVTAFPYPESAARTLALAADRADWLRRPLGALPELESLDPAAARTAVEPGLAAGGRWLEPGEVNAVLAAYGIPIVTEHVAETVDDAVSAAGDVGYPVVVKAAAAGTHKTEAGGVALRLESEAAVREAAQRIGLPVLVQPMIVDAAEFLAGAVQDPVFGPLVAFGPGGVMAELIGGTGFRIAPLADVDVDELLNEGKAGELVRGFRGRPPVDAAALGDLLLRLARLAADLPEIAELDLNPVLAKADGGCVAVDARIRVARPTGRERVKSW
jgi:acyl-CoA synthetase (NDP forming)